MKHQKKNIEKPPAQKTKKIKLFPTQEQRVTLNKWFGTARWTYNQCLQVIKDGTPRKQKLLRAKCVNNGNFSEQNQWAKDVPYDIRDEAMNDVLKAYRSNLAKEEKKHFEMKFKSKKAESDSIVIHSKHWKKAGVFHPTFFGKNPIKGSELLPVKLDYDCRLQRTRLGEFYLCLLSPLKIRGENQSPVWKSKDEGVISLDPGVQ